MGRAPCCDKAKVKKGPWSAEEDAKLKDYIHNNGTGGNWIALPQKVGVNRCGKSCRLRWLNYLRPNIKHGEFSDEEDGIICSLYATIGSRWSIIAAQLPGRTDNDIKNYWNTKLKKKFFMGFSSQSQERSSYQSNMITNHHLPSLNTTNLITPSPYLPQTPSFYDDSISNPKPFSILYKDPTTFTDGFFAPFHGNFEDVKSNIIIFGGEGGVTNSPDGSCITNPMNNHDNQGFLISDNEYGFSSANACFRQNNPLAYDGIQEITELISSSPICSDKLGFFVDYPPENVRF